MKKICIIPAYNEEEKVGEVVRKALKHVDDVIVIDDGSLDKTLENSLDAGAIVVRHLKNRGKGAALKTGFKHALNLNGDIIITLDADGQHDPQEIPLFIKKINEGFDVVIGSRFLGEKTKMPLQRVLSNKITTLLLRFFGVKVSDSQSGFRAFKKEVLKEIKFNSERYIAESEILIETAKKKFRIGEVNIKTTYEGYSSKINPFLDTLQFIWLILKKTFEKLLP